MGRPHGASQAAYGKNGQGVTGLLTYLGLTLGVLGGSLSLPWGLYVLIVQRKPERAPLEDVTPIDDRRRAATAAMLGIALAILLPLGLSPPQ